MKNTTGTFLVLLRLALGWALLVEGLEKLQKPDWTSEPYLREAAGPLAGPFRWMAGDAADEKLALVPLKPGEDAARTPPHTRMPPALSKQWQGYFDSFVAYYALDGQQRQEAERIFLQRQDQTVQWMQQGKIKLEKTFPKAPSTDVEKTPVEWRDEYLALRGRGDEIVSHEMSWFGRSADGKLATAKTDANRLRSVLVGNPGKTADWARQLDELEKPIQQRKQLLSGLDPKIQELEVRINKLDKAKPDEVEKLKKELKGLRDQAAAPKKELQDMLTRYNALLADVDLSKQTALMRRSLRDALNDEQRKMEPPPETVQAGWKFWNWTLLDWADITVKYGLTAAGVCLIIGLFTRSACVVGAVLILLFFLAMPPLPGLPVNPKAEGTYLYINKTFIMVLALLALATTRSGRWLGLDALLQFANPRRWRHPPLPDRRAWPRDAGPATPRPDLGGLEPVEVLTVQAVGSDNGSETKAVSAHSPIPKESSDGH